MTQSAVARLRFPLLLMLLMLPISGLLALAYRNQPGAATITVYPAERHQAIHGWEAVAQGALDYLDEQPNGQEVLDELLDKAVDLGLTRLRLEAPSSIENTRDFFAEYAAGAISAAEWRCGRYSTVNDDASPASRRAAGFRWETFDRNVRRLVLPLKARLAARGEALWLNVTYVAFTDQICDGSSYDHADAEEYAEFVTAVHEHLRDEFGLVPDSWELMLEPDTTRVWTAERLAAAAAAAAPRLSAAGFTPSFVAPATTNAGRALPYMAPLWEQEPLRGTVTELSYHRYGGADAETIAAIGAWGRTHGVPTAMLEHIGSAADALHEDLTSGNVSAWEQFALAWPDPDSGAHYFILDAGQPAGARAQLSSTGRYLRQYFRAFRPGGVRVGATSSDAAFAPVAVQHEGGRTAVVIKAARAGRLTIEGLGPGAYTTSCWTERAQWDRTDDPCAGSVDVDARGAAVVLVPEAGVFSVVRERHVAP